MEAQKGAREQRKLKKRDEEEKKRKPSQRMAGFVCVCVFECISVCEKEKRVAKSKRKRGKEVPA